MKPPDTSIADDDLPEGVQHIGAILNRFTMNSINEKPLPDQRQGQLKFSFTYNEQSKK